MLFQRSVDRIKFAVEVATQPINNRNDRKRDTGCDQAIFNRGRAGLIGQEVQKVTAQNLPPFDCDEAINDRRNTDNGVRMDKSTLHNLPGISVVLRVHYAHPMARQRPAILMYRSGVPLRQSGSR
jgi:hypothetical protein